MLLALAALAAFALWGMRPSSAATSGAPATSTPAETAPPAREREEAVTQRDPSRYVFWLASRSVGIAAFLLVATSVILGLYMAANLGRRPGYKRVMSRSTSRSRSPRWSRSPPRAAAARRHVAAPRLGGLVIPFTMPYRPVWTGIGIVAGYLALALGLTFYVRRRLGPARWRKAHRLIALVYVMGAVHALGAGSDGGGVWLRVLVVVTALPIAGLLVPRYRPRHRPARVPAPARGEPRSAQRRPTLTSAFSAWARRCGSWPTIAIASSRRGPICWASTSGCRASAPTASCRASTPIRARPCPRPPCSERPSAPVSGRPR